MMNLLLRQIWALIRKNLLIICARRPISTFIRAIAIPLVVVLVVAYSKNFFSSPQTWGVSSPHHLRSFKEGLSASNGRDIIGFVDNGMKGGDVSSVIESLSQQIRDAGKTPKIYNDGLDLAKECKINTNGVSPCYGAVIFHSSPTQGTNLSDKGYWNYTLRGEGTMYGGFADISSDRNGPEVYLLPLQRAVDEEIIARSRSDNATTLPSKMEVIVYTNQDQGALDDSRTSTYLTMATYIFGPVFAFTMVGIVYHMTSFVSRERELGMSSLIDAMIPGGSNIRGRLARQMATYISFATVYFPSWIAVGIVVSVVVFPEKSRGIPVAYHICSGLAFTSFSLFGASFFKKAQLSGSIMVVIALVFAILPAVLVEQSKIACGILSFLFPSSNYTYFLTGIATFEKANVPLSMMKNARTDEYEPDEWRLELFYHWIFVVIQILVYPVLAFFVEHILFSTASSNRKFVLPSNQGDPTVTLSGFSKTYHPGILSKLFKRRKDVKAVVDMNLQAYPGQILCLLGPNGSGKSTTLNCIAADTKVTSGSIAIDPTGGLGYAPQNNVIWPELTVEEHVRIFSDLKCLSDVNDEIVKELVRDVDLQKKLSHKAKTLSGGQKRKLQLAMMFAGGSAVCCVDEVSTGLDPISRRRIWEILLAERSRRTIIMTTHFLDEADFLADTIAIMYKGSLRAEGTPATLKSRYGNGYTIKLPNHMDLEFELSGPVEKEDARHQTVYRVATAALAAELAEFLERQKIEGYQVSGPTMEELFLKATGDTITTEDASSDHEVVEESKAVKSHAIVHVSTDKYDLDEGHPISVFNQWWILLCKRFRIIRRRWIPYFVAAAFAIVGAGVAPLLIKSFNYDMKCPVPADLVVDYTYRRDFGVDYYNIDASGDPFSYYGSSTLNYIYGPASKIDDSRLDIMAEAYSVDHTRSYSDKSVFGYTNGSQIRDQLRLVDTFDEFKQAIKVDWANNTKVYGYLGHPYTYVKGGIWMGDETSEPTVLINVGQSDYNSQMMNFLNVMAGGIPISTAYYQFATTKIPQVYDIKPMMFIIYYGLIMACYPAFFILYPTNERISNVRSMQYSNGIRPVPLWLSHLAFDGIFVLIISAVATGLLSASTPIWHGLGLVFIVFFLYGIVCALLSYIISMFARGAVTAWFMMALGQVIFYFAYFGGLIGVQSVTPYQDLEHVMNALYFGMGIVSPVVSLERTLVIGLDQFATNCNGRSDSSIYMYGGPILYLILQAIFLFGLLLWWDSGFVFPALRRSRQPAPDPEGDEQYSSDLRAELKRLTSPNTQLRVESVSKKFGKNLAVDNVTFGVHTSEIFALLGPNGAGKSTVISMIRGDIKPSTPQSSIQIAGHSILSSPVAARSSLGVCPQFDSADVLTVRETLRFFAKTRGVANIDQNVAVVIAATGIEAWADQLAQKLSGGTKRKLSLAVALVGNPQVLVLDEPSSALDANAKRTMWKCLQSIGKGRAMVLTTHSMEEADALADRIGIVSSRMLALGSREDLKKRAGDAYHIHLVSRSAPRTTQAELQAMKGWIHRTFPNANISRETQGGQIRFEIPAEGRELVGLIKILENAKGDLGVEFYSVGKATLDEVFENIVRRYGDGEERD